MPSCVVKNCMSNANVKNEAVSYHCFPKSYETTWKRAINQPMLKLKKNAHRVCSRHFLQSDYLAGYKSRRRLKHDAVPSQNIPSVHFKRPLHFDVPTATLPAEPKKIIAQHGLRADSPQLSQPSPGSSSSLASFEFGARTKSEQNLYSSSSLSSASSQRRRKNVMTVKLEHSYGISPSAKARILSSSQRKIKAYKHKLKMTSQKLRRLKRRVFNLKGIVLDLQKKNKISMDASIMLESTFSGVPLLLMKRMLSNMKKGKVTRKTYPTELKNFAMTLQFYSPKAYIYVRKTFELGLPAPSVIRSWLSKVDCEPGYSQPALSLLAALAKEKTDTGEELLCALMFDEISIKKKIDVDGKKLITRGYVDCGTGASDDTTLAGEALVLMVVCVNAAWKLPVAYFLIAKLTAHEKANIVLQALRLLHANGVKVISFTCDGPHVNVAMAKELGCVFEFDAGKLITWFLHPVNNTKVFMFFDVCHMLKLARNNLSKMGAIKNPNGEIISWHFIEKLHKIQEEETLKLGNKLSKLHIAWQKAPMKVNMAAQTLSASVAKALTFLKNNLHHPEFQDAGATIEFIELINDLFDILNSRNPYGRGRKTPLRPQNESYWKPFMESAIRYLWTCTSIDGKPLYTTANKTPFIGFIISATSALALYTEYVVEKHSLQYILTYKMSQDHLELFFCQIRSRNGFNNNPSCAQFIQSYKRLLVHSTLNHFGGNCTPQDNTELLTPLSLVENVSYSQSLGISTISDFRAENDDGRYAPEEHEDMHMIDVRLSCMAENVIAYIAGFVVRMTRKNIKCDFCIKALYAADTTANDLQFIMLKNQGGLVFPSNSVRRICQVTETKIRNVLYLFGNRPPPHDTLSRLLETQLEMQLVQEVRTVFPDLTDHIFDQGILEKSHRQCLIGHIVRNYTKVRYHSAVKTFNQFITGDPIRKELSKLILFKHQ